MKKFVLFLVVVGLGFFGYKMYAAKSNVTALPAVDQANQEDSAKTSVEVAPTIAKTSVEVLPATK